MGFSDIFKKSFLEGFEAVDTRSILVAFLLSTAVALYIFLAYRVLTRKTFYSKNFNISLPCITLITAAIILTIQSSIVVSLGMVGALSIVRFRTAIKDPMDLMFLFWAISVGIICGAGLAEIALILSLLLTVLMLFLNKLPSLKAPLLLVVSAGKSDAEGRICEVVARYAKHYAVKSRNVTASSLNLVLELRAADGGALVQELVALPEVLSANVMDHDGETSF